MSAIASAPAIGRAVRTERVSWLRVLWVAPFTLVVAVLACFGLRALLQSLDPSLSQMGQLGLPMITLTIEGALAAIVVFILFALFVPRAIY
jgi:hypothetical protein